MFDVSLETEAGPAIGAEDSFARKLRVLVVGVGNILLKDEGVGVHVVRKLGELALPNDVEVVDGGTAGLDILLLYEDVERLIVIDATRAGNKAGTIYKAHLMGGEMEKLTQLFGQKAESKISLHQIGLIEGLAAAEKLNCEPKEIVIIGVEPGEWDCGLELTGPVARSIPEVVKKVLEETGNVIHREQADRCDFSQPRRREDYLPVSLRRLRGRLRNGGRKVAFGNERRVGKSRQEHQRDDLGGFSVQQDSCCDQISQRG
ncbi:MAG: hypothetical protein DRP65_05420 [Planctomycetota bacterium]|nr:MAG: hypothetical protein DRP65_05420 [Planctomycetota bacterium]